MKTPAIRTALILLTLPLLLLACRENADSFFSGRPSGMAMIHNRIIAGPPETMVELLRVPARFPDARPEHIDDWQESALAWWRQTERQQGMLAACTQLPPAERAPLRAWLAQRSRERSHDKARTLDELAAALAPCLSPAQDGE